MYSFNKLLSAGLGLAALLIVYFWLKKIASREENKGKELGVVIMDLMAQNGVSIYMIFLIGFNLASAVIAASITDERSNPVARIITHFSINALATVGAFQLIPKGRLLFKWRKNEKEWFSGWIIFSRFVTVILLVMAAIWLPILNVQQIAHSLGESKQLTLWFASHSLFVSDGAFLQMVQNANIVPIDQAPFYDAYQALNNIIVTELVLLLSHFLIIAFEIFNSHDAGVTAFRPAVSKDDKKGSEDKGKGKSGGEDTKTKEEEEKSMKNDFMSTLGNILSFLGIAVKDTVLTQALSVIEEHFTVAQTDALAAELSKMNIQIKDFARLTDDAAKNKIKQDMENEIRTRFAKSRKDGGFGITLPAKK